MPFSISCPTCGEEYPVNTFEWSCIRCGGHFEIAGSPDYDSARIDRSVSSAWRYRALLPLPAGGEPVSLGEGWTPLVPLVHAGVQVFCKLEFLNPTGSFKDRGTTVMVSALKALGIQNVVEDSSGNAAASLAAYAARAGLRADVYVPAHTTSNKLLQTRAYGVVLHPVEGPRENAGRAAEDAVVSAGAYYASHYYNPFFLSGMQTAAWEIWEQLGERAPQNIFLPVGHGTHLIGLYRGFQKLLAAKRIARLPRLFAAQAAKIAPLAAAFERGEAEPVPVPPAQTIAEGIAISRPVRGAEILRAIRATGGAVIAVDEVEIRAAQVALAHQGMLVEPTSATAVAALDKVQDLQGITVVSLTGSGLKSLSAGI